MLRKFFRWTRASILIGVLASMLLGMPVQAGGIQSNPIRDAKAAVAPPRPTLASPVKDTLIKATGEVTSVTLKWKRVTGIDRYHVQVSTSSTNFEDWLLISDNNILGVSLGTAVAPGVRYYWRVAAINDANEQSDWSAIWNFKVGLLRPTLSLPANTDVLTVDRPTFTWNAATNTNRYRLQVSALQDFSTLLVNVLVDNATTYSVNKDLPQNRILYWRVRGLNDLLSSPWSAKWSFKSGNPPGVPGLISPGNGTISKDFTPLLDWNNSALPTGVTLKQYELQLDDDADFSSPVEEASGTTSNFTVPSDLVSETKYFWRVRAVGIYKSADHVSGWSPRWSFTIALPPPTSLTVIPNGSNPLRPSFDWDDGIGSNVTGYTIQISARADFSILLVNSTTVNSSYAMAKNLPAGKTIHWRVRVNGTNGPSAWTTTQFDTP